MGSTQVKKELIDRQGKLSIRKQCNLLGISRSSVYYEPKGESEENQTIMRLMDEHILEEPTAGVLTMQSMLKDQGIKAGYERVRRLMRKACIRAIYPRRHLTVLGKVKYVHPYLLRNLDINRPNQVWAIDITYIPMARGHLYLTAVIDVYSRYIVGWDISNTLAAEASLAVVKQAIEQHGKPETINSDQGVQFTCHQYVDYLKSNDIKISMDGKGRALDNIYIERFWRTIKYQYIYLNPAQNGLALRKGIAKWLRRYHHRDHQGINRTKPAVRYQQAA